MEEAVSGVLAEYEARIAAESTRMQSLDAAQWIARRDEFLLPIGPDTGRVPHGIHGARS